MERSVLGPATVHMVRLMDFRLAIDFAFISGIPTWTATLARPGSQVAAVEATSDSPEGVLMCLEAEVRRHFALRSLHHEVGARSELGLKAEYDALCRQFPVQTPGATC